MQSRPAYETPVASANKTELRLSKEPASPGLQPGAHLERRRPGPTPARAYDDRPRRVLALTCLRTRQATLAASRSLTRTTQCGTGGLQTAKPLLQRQPSKKASTGRSAPLSRGAAKMVSTRSVLGRCGYFSCGNHFCRAPTAGALTTAVATPSTVQGLALFAPCRSFAVTLRVFAIFTAAASGSSHLAHTIRFSSVHQSTGV